MIKTLRAARDFTPAVPVLGACEPIVSLFTRERHWRSALRAQLAPRRILERARTMKDRA